MRFLSVVLALGLAACGTSSSSDAGIDAPSADAGGDGGHADGATDGGVDAAHDAGNDAPSADLGVDGDAAATDLGDVDADAASDDASMDAGIGDATIFGDAFGLPDADPIFDASVDDGSVFSSVTTTHPADPPIPPATECVVTRADTVSRSALHVPICSLITTWETTPPCHGDHYPIWADYKSYDLPVPWGFLVHPLEHGGMVISYRCASGTACPATRDALQAFIDGYAADPLCTATPARSRMILVPEPTLPVPIAAVTWGHLYEATCIDVPSLTTFADDTYGMAPEDFCSPGIDLSTSPGGWCPPPVMDAGVADMATD